MMAKIPYETFDKMISRTSAADILIADATRAVLRARDIALESGARVVSFELKRLADKIEALRDDIVDTEGVLEAESETEEEFEARKAAGDGKP